MNRILIASLVLLVAVAAAAGAYQIADAEEGYGKLTLESLSTSKVGNFPKKWRTWPLQGKEAAKIYTVAEQGGKKYIRAFDEENLSRQIFLNFNWDISKRPLLSWRWRATVLPDGAKENDDARNDSACGVYVVIGRYSGHAIKYVWSSTLAPGTVISRHKGKLKIKVLESGLAKQKSWVSHQVDVEADYKELFGHALEKNPSGIGLLTDGNAVQKPAGCDYADFAISGR